MLTLEIPRPPGSPLRVLCLGAHSDDIEIGCGGTLLQLAAARRSRLSLDWVVFSGNPVRSREARASARRMARGARLKFTAFRFRDGFFPSQIVRIKEEFERLKRGPAPDLIFTPWRDDAHQDHRTISELTANTFRDHLVLEYEIAKYDGDLRTPNLYVPVSETACAAKLKHLAEAFPSQRGNGWFEDEAFRALLRLRGIESNSPSRYAEGFHCRKLVLAG